MSTISGQRIPPAPASGKKTLVSGILDKLYANKLIPGVAAASKALLGRAANPVYNPGEGSAQGAEQTFEVDVIVAEYTVGERMNSAIQSGDVKVRVQAKAEFTVEPDNTLEIGGVTYRVVDVQPRQFSGQVIEYVCQARR